MVLDAGVSLSARGDGDACGWCGDVLSSSSSATAKFCCQKCRQSAFRARKRASLSPGHDDGPRRFAYADPPYPGFSKLYEGHPDFAGEVDHQALVVSLMATDDAGQPLYAGWALSTSAKTLREVLPLCPPEARVVAWVKPIGVSRLTYGMHNTWEPVIVFAGRQRRPGKRDWFQAQPAKLGGSDLIGRKPDAFCQAVFERLGMQEGDVLDDLFPGSGAVMRSWLAVGGCRGDGVWSPSSSDVAYASSTAAVNDEASSSTSATTRRRSSTNDATVVQVHNDGASLLQERRNQVEPRRDEPEPSQERGA